jgi:hypothetical protein
VCGADNGRAGSAGLLRLLDDCAFLGRGVLDHPEISGHGGSGDSGKKDRPKSYLFHGVTSAKMNGVSGNICAAGEHRVAALRWRMAKSAGD